MGDRVRPVRRVVALILPIALAGGAGVSAQTRRAVLVGIDTYTSAASSPSLPASGRPADAWTNLEGALNDVEAVRQVLVTRLGFKDSDVHVLTNDAATRDRIVVEIRRWLLDAAAPGDVSVFYFAGHGSQVRNSRSQEPDGMDETIVPADAARGRPDLRDKELAKPFLDILDKRVFLTVAFDSCHSGSISRGDLKPIRVRAIAPDTRDVADPETPPSLESRGAVVLSAAQSHQSALEAIDEDGTAHGLFTWALLKTLRAVPVTTSAERVFLSVRALMQSAGAAQDPDLSALPGRRQVPLFASSSSAQAGPTVIALQSVDADGAVLLQGGIAAGIRPGCELRSTNQAITLRVTGTIGITRSRAVVTGGDAKTLQPGALFTVTRWAAPRAPILRVWLADATLKLQLGAGTANDAIDVLPSPAGADYMLTVRRTGALQEYAWTRPLTGEATTPGPMPVRTDWIAVNPDTPETAIRRLEQQALRLGVVRAWLQLESPGDDGTFPFHLALRNAATEEVRITGPAREGEVYGVVLVPEGGRAQPLFTRRYVYVFALDSDGRSTLLYPSASAGGGGENFLPSPTRNTPATDAPIALGRRELFKIQPPFGVDTFLMLTTRTPLADPSVLQGAAVRSRDVSRTIDDPLARLLSQVGASTRSGSPLVTPPEWSIERVTIASVPVAQGEPR